MESTDTLTMKYLVKNENRSLIYILLVLAIVYFPFVDKAFTIDDTIHMKAAEHILVDPLDFYGGEDNWYGTEVQHYLINKNPPLVAYLIAGVASVFGFNEVALHSFFFLFVALSAIGIYQLGRQFNTNPLLTTVLAAFTPVFLVHSTNVMTDSTMLTFWIWGLVFWNNGCTSNNSKWFYFAGLSVSLGILTKYTCIFLLPLMIFSGLWRYRKPGPWLFAILIPLVVMLGFEHYTRILYGKGLFLQALIYANEAAPKNIVDYFDNSLIGLSFLGGCFPIALLVAAVSGGRLLRLVASLFAILTLFLLFSRGGLSGHSFVSDGATQTNLIIQFATFCLAGFCSVLICLKEFRKGFNHDSIFLLLWFFGVFIFVCYLNWSINARSFILLVPAIGLLLSRRLEEWGVNQTNLRTRFSYLAIGVAGLLAVATVYADYAWAKTASVAARDITSKFNQLGKVWFQGHWGFQFYMEESGAQPVDFAKSNILPGEFMVIPLNNTNLVRPDYRFDLVETREYSHDSFIAIMSPARSAGFYASVFGAVPYSFEKPLKDVYLVYKRNDRD